jgi:hypothetical protein
MIKSAPFSFVRFEHPPDSDYTYDIPYSLPVYQKHNLAFQFIVDVDRLYTDNIFLGIANPAGVFVSSFSAPSTPLNYRYRLPGIPSAFTLNTITINGTVTNYGGTNYTDVQFKKLLGDDFGIELIDDYFISDAADIIQIDAADSGSGAPGFPVLTDLPIYWHYGYNGLTNVNVASYDCFCYALLDVDETTVLGYSNKFHVVDEEEFTSLVKYWGNENGFEFIYPGGKFNMVRLPFYLQKPQYPKKREVYRRSSGRQQLLSSQVDKEYEIDTEQMGEVFHECMAIMLGHDNIIIENINIREITVEVLESDNYSPQWESEEGSNKSFPYAKAKGKLKVSSFSYSNSNCS